MENIGFRAGLSAAGNSSPRVHRADATGNQTATIGNPWENQRFLAGRHWGTAVVATDAIAPRAKSYGYGQTLIKPMKINEIAPYAEDRPRRTLRSATLHIRYPVGRPDMDYSGTLGEGGSLHVPSLEWVAKKDYTRRICCTRFRPE